MPNIHRNKQAPWLLFFGFCAAVILLAIFSTPAFGRRQAIHFDFTDSSTVKEWTLNSAAASSVSAEGLTIPQGPFQLLSPGPVKTPLGDAHINWSQFPYIRIRLDQCPREREAVLIWNPENSLPEAYFFLFQVPPGTGTFILDARALRYATGITSIAESQIGQFGLQAEDGFQIKEISLLSALPIADLWTYLKTAFLSPETFNAYVINYLNGFYLYARPLVFQLGVILLILGAISLACTTKVTLKLFIAAALFGHIILDMQFDVSLIRHTQSGLAHSAWHEDPYAERTSRFGRSFAELARVFEEHVPEGSRVFFPEQQWKKSQGETNWVWFHFFPAFEATPLAEAEYVFCFYPYGLEFEFRGGSTWIVRDKSSEKAVRAELIVEVNPDVRLFKVIGA